jgi:pyrroline-5-carboxylate reductase
MKTTGFIGGGRVTRIFLKAWHNREVMPEKVVVYDINDETVAKLKSEFSSIEVSTDLKAVAGQEVVFIALHPPVIMETLDKIAADIGKDSIVISLAPKISVEKSLKNCRQKILPGLYQMPRRMSTRDLIL